MSISSTHPNTAGYPDSAAFEDSFAESLRAVQHLVAERESSPGISASRGRPTAEDISSETLLQQLIDDLQALAVETSKYNRNDGVVNRQGAPALYVPEEDISVNDQVVRMMFLTNDSHQKLMDWMAKDVDNTIAKLNKSTQVRIAKAKEIEVKTLESAKAEKSAKVWGWIGKVAAFVGALAAVIVTGAGAIASGGAGTVLFVLSMMALINATLSLAGEISKEFGGPEISVSNLISHTTVPMLEALGLEHDTAQTIAISVAALPMIFIEPQMLGEAVEGLCKLAGVEEETAKRCGQVVGTTAAIVTAVVLIGTAFFTGGASLIPLLTRIARGAQIAAALGQGGFKISSAVTMKEVGYIEAETAKLEADSALMRKQLDIDQEAMKNLLQCVQRGTQSAAQVINDLQRSKQQVSQNMVRSPV